MKTLLTSAALAAMMTTSAMAFTTPNVGGSGVWNGNPGPLGESCKFLTNEAGAMNYDGAQTWTTTSPAIVTLQLLADASSNGTQYYKNVKVQPAVWDSANNEFVTGTNTHTGKNGSLHNGNTQDFSNVTNPTEAFDVEVNYNGTTGNTRIEEKSGGSWITPTAGNVNINNNAMQLESQSNSSKEFKFTIHGTATHIDNPPALTANEDYQVSHLITCIQ